MKVVIVLLLLLQETTVSTAENPLAQLKDEVKLALANAGLPFTEEQERALVIMMEERRRSSEELFGEIMDFSAGPTQGQQADRARDAIQWMRGEFLTRLRDYLTPAQLAVWEDVESRTEAEISSTAGQLARASASPQTQYVRINNNVFTAEEAGYRFGLGNNRGGTLQPTEVIQRGGAGAFHGNLQILVKDESLNARNPFAHNKPPYQERQGAFDFGGPVIPGRLTSTLYADQSEAENVDTIRATLPDGIFDQGITRPTLSRRVGTRGTYQLTDEHSLTFNVRYGANSRKNQNTGGFNLPERASDSRGNNWNFELRQFSALSSEALFESRFELSANHEETTPFSNEVQINVLDAFRSGGSQNEADYNWRNHIFSSMYSRLGEKLTFKTGVEGVYRTSRSFAQNNFFGSFTFSSLDAFLRGEALTYRENRGDPLLETNQTELSFFFQSDWNVSSRLTFMHGVRYDFQTNLRDRNNIAPRFGVAYSPGAATVIRGGVGVFYQRMGLNINEAQQRHDGARQFEIVIDNPSFPDPFQAGTVRNIRSLRVTDPGLASPYNIIAMASVERTFFRNLVFSAAYDINREVHRLRYRNLNAPLDITSSVPRSCSPEQSAETCVRPQPDAGNILNLESTGLETAHNFRLNFRQRFSIFNVTGSYSMAVVYGDSIPNAGLGNSQGASGNQGAIGDHQLATDNYNLRVDWGRAPFPMHQFNGSVNAQLPFGLFMTGSVSANSGRYYNITTGRDDNRDSVVNDRPAGVRWYSENGPNFLSLNFNISKAFFFSSASNGSSGGGARTNMNVFANMTNAFNHLNPGSPSGVMTSPNFGRSTSAVDPRQIEIGLRFQF